MSINRVAIIGAGVSGLVLANKLKAAASYDIEVFEKSAGVGGRLATHYNDMGHQFDIGAQFFTAKTSQFQDYLLPFVDKKLLKSWQGRFVEIDNNRIAYSSTWNQQYPHYVPSPKMTSWCKDLAKSHNLHLKTRITEILLHKSGCLLYDNNQQQYGPFDCLILAIPVKQAIDLLPSISNLHKALSHYTMEPCFSVSLGFSTEVNFPFASAVVKNRDISFITNNGTRPDRAHHLPSVTILSTNLYAQQHQEISDADIIEHLVHEAEFALQQSLAIPTYRYLHRWRYANAKKVSKQLSFFDQQYNIGICGDWCRQGVVEAAFLSAEHLYETIINID